MLIVEDDYFIAMDMEYVLLDAGVEVVGPARSVAIALSIIERNAASLHAAVLDLDLGTDMSYPVADRLAALGIPFIFATGILPAQLPYRDAYSHLRKPVRASALLKSLDEMLRKR